MAVLVGLMAGLSASLAHAQGLTLDVSSNSTLYYPGDRLENATLKVAAVDVASRLAVSSDDTAQ